MRKPKAVRIMGLLILVAAGISMAASPSGLPLTLTATNSLDIARAHVPVSWSIPLGVDDGILDPTQLSLWCGNTRLPTQATPLARWGGTPDDATRPIAWLLLDVQLDFQPFETKALTLKHDTSPLHPTDMVIAQDNASGMVIRTGAAEFTLSRTAFRLLDSVTLTDGSTFQGPAGLSLNGQITAQNAAITVEHQGVNRVSLWIHGTLQGNLEYTARMHFFRGLACVKVDFRVENLTAVQVDESGQPNANDYGCPGSIAIDDLSLIWPTLGGGHYTLPTGEFGQTGTQTGTFSSSLTVIQESSGEARWDALQDFSPRLQSGVQKRSSTVILDGQTQNGPNQVAGWMHIDGVTVACEAAWQNFPKAWRGTPNSLEMGLFPDEFSRQHEFRPGEFKTHTVWVDFHALNDPDVANQAHSMLSCVRLLPSVRHTTDCGAAGPVIPRVDAHFPDYEQGTDYQLIPSPEWRDEYASRTVLEAISLSQNYGWVDFGDIPTDFEMITSPFNQKYESVRGMCLQALRNKDRDLESTWWELASSAARHCADIDMLHSRTRGHDTTRIWYEGGMYGHAFHDEDGRTNPHRNMMNPSVSMSGPSSGLFLYALLSGDTLLLDSAFELAENMLWRTVHTDYWQAPQCAQNAGLRQCSDDCEGYSEPDFGRTLGICAKTMMMAYLASGDDAYFDVIPTIADHLLCAENQGVAWGCDRFNIQTTLYRTLGHYLQWRDMLEMGRDTITESLITQRAAYITDTLWDEGEQSFAFCYDDAVMYTFHDNWLFSFADTLAAAFRVTGTRSFLDTWAMTAFLDGAGNQFYQGSALSYHSAKEYVNQVGFGHLFLLTWFQDQLGSLRHTVSLQAEGAGSLAPASSADVLHGDDLVIAVIPDPGAAIADVSVDGKSQGPLTQVVLQNITEPREVRAIFSGAAQNRVIWIPHIATSAAWQCTLVMDQPGDTIAQARLTLMDQGIDVHAETVTIPARSRRSITLDQGTCGWVTTADSTLQIKQLFVSSAEGGMVEFFLDEQTGTAFDFLYTPDFSDRLTWAGLALMNPNENAGTAQLTARNVAGEILDTASLEIQPQSRSVGFIADFFGGLDWTTVARAEASTSVPMTGITISGETNARLLFTRTAFRHPTSSIRDIPHIASAFDTWQNTLVFDHVGDDAANVMIRLFREGNQVAGETAVLPPHTQVGLDLNAYRDLNPTSGTISGGLSEVHVRQSFVSTSSGGWAEFLLGHNVATNLAFTFPSVTGDLINWRGLAFSNSSDESTPVTLTAYHAGQIAGTVSADLGAHSRTVGLLEAFFPDLNPATVDRVLLQADQPCTGIHISGHDQERLLFTPAMPTP